MKKVIVLVGAGNFGERYVQGMIKIQEKYDIYVIDKNENRLKELKLKYDNMNFHKNLTEVPKIINLLIVSTTSLGRYQLLIDILFKYKVEFCILEKIIAASSTELIGISKLINETRRTFVNYPRRQMNNYMELKNSLSKDNIKKVSIKGVNWELLTNSVHFIDLFEWLANSKVRKINIQDPYSEWKESKRKGFFDIYGHIEIEYVNGIYLELISSVEKVRQESIYPKIEIHLEKSTITIMEEQGRIKINEDDFDFGHLELQSSNTSDVIEELHLTGNCKLPEFYDVFETNLVLLKELNRFWEKKNMSLKHGAMKIT